MMGDEGVKKVRDALAGLHFAKTDAKVITVCKGAQQAIFATAQDAHGHIILEQIVAMGDNDGMVITYEIPDGRPDPKAESAIRTICTP